MSGRPAVRLVSTLALTLFLLLPGLGQATPRPALGSSRTSLLELVESFLPEVVRAWLAPRAHVPAQPRVPLKCGAGIDPNGKPCP
jgi:hypothetical protein